MSHKHLPQLDGLRGFAVLMVFFFHFWGGASSSNAFVRAQGLLVQAGWSGVTLFFVLSGFLISGIIWDDRDSAGWWKNFYARRGLRIFPLYYLSLALVVLTAIWYGEGAKVLHGILPYLFYLHNVTPLSGTGSPLSLAHIWSLAVEEQFYLVWPLLLAAMPSSRGARWMCVLIFSGSFACRLETIYGTHGILSIPAVALARWGDLAVGSFLALCFRSPDLWRRVCRVAPYAAAASLTVFLSIGFVNRSFKQEPSEMYIGGTAAISIFFGAVLVLALTRDSFSRFFSLQLLRRFGLISYGFYIFQGLFNPLYEWLTLITVGEQNETRRALVRFVYAAILTYLLASLSFRFFEVPFLRLRSRFRTR